MPNPLRNLAQGDDLYVVMVPLWGDDVSGNKSKQYNKHINIYMANSCLPGQLLQQEYFVQFVSTSPHATSPEQFAALRDQIKYVLSHYSDSLPQTFTAIHTKILSNVIMQRMVATVV